MTEFTRKKVLRKLELLAEYLKKLQRLEREIKDEKEFYSDFKLYGTAERFLQLACQITIDTLDLIIVEEDLEKPENRGEQISLIFNAKIISGSLSSKIEDIVKFRNILVHEYGEIDRKKVYKNFISKMEDFKIFKKEIINWLKKK